MTIRDTILVYYDTSQITRETKVKGRLAILSVELDDQINHGIIIHGKGGRILKM